MENKKKVILDCDPGHDDAFGIMLAVQHLDVLGITTIGGNCTLENVTRNAIKVLEVLGVADRIGVYPGHSCPMVARRDWSGRSRAAGADARRTEQACGRLHRRHRNEHG